MLNPNVAEPRCTALLRSGQSGVEPLRNVYLLVEGSFRYVVIFGHGHQSTWISACDTSLSPPFA